MPCHDRLRRAFQAFDLAHDEDPRTVASGDDKISWSLHYHRRLTHWVRQLSPDPPEELLLAARSQHIRRWRIDRQDYPAGRDGYRGWRKALARFHAQEAGRILSEAGYPTPIVERVQQLLQKFRLRLDPEVQLFEDAICLVFLENELAEFSRKHEREKLISILRKTWRKMSPGGREAALRLAESLPEETARLLREAVSDD